MEYRTVIEELNRVSFDREEQEVVVSGLQDIETLQIAGKPVSIRKNIDLAFPYWAARILIDEKVVQPSQRREVDVAKISRAMLTESKSVEVTPLDDYFFIKVTEYLHGLDANGGKLATLKKERAYREFRDLVIKRIQKIMKLAEKGKGISHTVNNLLPEERFLIDHIGSVLDDWKEFFFAES